MQYFRRLLPRTGNTADSSLIPKKDGTMRPLIDISTLNTFVENSHFQMENLSSTKSLLRSGNFMTKLDLHDANLTVEIDPLLQKFLRFIWKNKVYQFQALPFGVNVVPRVFTKLLKQVEAFVRKQGICLVLYLNDMLIIGISGNSVVLSTSYRPSHCFGLQRPQREVNNKSNSGKAFTLTVPTKRTRPDEIVQDFFSRYPS